MWQDLAVSDVNCLWVCLCLDKLELVAKFLPQSSHLYLVLEAVFWYFDLPSVWYNESIVKALIKCSGTDCDKDDASEEAGDEGGEGDEGSESLEVVLKLRSRASSSAGSDLMLKEGVKLHVKAESFQTGDEGRDSLDVTLEVKSRG